MGEVRTFKCEGCGKVFDTEHTDEAAIAEMKKIYGDIPEERRSIVCDDCHEVLMKFIEAGLISPRPH